VAQMLCQRSLPDARCWNWSLGRLSNAPAARQIDTGVIIDIMQPARHPDRKDLLLIGCSCQWTSVCIQVPGTVSPLVCGICWSRGTVCGEHGARASTAADDWRAPASCHLLWQTCRGGMEEVDLMPSGSKVSRNVNVLAKSTDTQRRFWCLDCKLRCTESIEEAAIAVEPKTNRWSQSSRAHGYFAWITAHVVDQSSAPAAGRWSEPLALDFDSGQSLTILTGGRPAAGRSEPEAPIHTKAGASLQIFGSRSIIAIQIRVVHVKLKGSICKYSDRD
jgi:hypothetical protein